MSVQRALDFIAAVRRPSRVRDRLLELPADAGLEAAALIGADEGFEFSGEELREAHKQDWAMRWLRSRAKGPPDPQPSAAPSEL